ncbi:MAG: class I SAM-dependent methyltransferase [Anaerolineae bacterium]|nr:class I SAM-dependent methyltransferase [Anaerolineae bacterium]
MINDHLLKMFDRLNEFGVTQFKSHISSSQYLLAYQLVMDYAKPAGSVLDWGTGKGHFSLFLLEQGFQVSGFTLRNPSSLSEYLAIEYRDHYQLIIDPESVKMLPFNDKTFDLVTSIGVLEHVRETGGDEIDSLLEIKRILKPGGIFICYHFPNKYSWIEAIIKYIKNKYNHPYKYSRKDIYEMLKQTGWELIDTKRYGILPRLIFRTIPNRLCLTNTFNTIDIFFSKLFPIICQNHYFVARKPQ